MTCDFTSFSTVFLSYQGDEGMIIKGCVQWTLFYGRNDFRLDHSSVILKKQAEITKGLLLCKNGGKSRCYNYNLKK